MSPVYRRARIIALLTELGFLPVNLPLGRKAGVAPNPQIHSQATPAEVSHAAE